MCSQADFITEIQKRLKDVVFHRAEVKTLELVENGTIKPCAVLVSSSGKIYRLAEKIDDVQKGAGAVRKAFQLNDSQLSLDYERPLAAKIYPISNLRTNRLGDDFIQEIIVHFTVSKMAVDNFVEGIVPFYECIVTDDSLMMLMPFYNKKDLFYYLTQSSGLLPVDTVKSIFRRIVTAVAMLHECGYIHRDISCENIYFHSDTECSSPAEATHKRIKKEMDNAFDLGDFGMSASLAATSSLSQDLGKPSYKSPQLVTKKLQSPEDWQANDVWSLGVVLYLMLMKAFPFGQAHKNDSLFMDRVVGGKMEVRARHELSRSCYTPFNKDLDDRLQGLELVRRILSFKPTERPSAASIRDHPWLREELVPFSKLNSIYDNVLSFPMAEIHNKFVLLMDESKKQENIMETSTSHTPSSSAEVATTMATTSCCNSTHEAA